MCFLTQDTDLEGAEPVWPHTSLLLQHILKCNEFSYTEQITSTTCLVTQQPTLAFRCKQDALQVFTTGTINKEPKTLKTPIGTSLQILNLLLFPKKLHMSTVKCHNQCSGQGSERQCQELLVKGSFLMPKNYSAHSNFQMGIISKVIQLNIQPECINYTTFPK